jgi:acyl-CoA synthetase (AMP-forming)/AMP-acid ligase II
MLKLTQILERAAQMYPDAPAITFEGRTHTWREYHQRCARLAGALKALGVRAGDRVAIISHNSDYFCEVFYGPAMIGAIYAGINCRWALPEMIACVEDCTPKVLIADKSFVEEARAMSAACPGIDTLIYADSGETPEGFLNYDVLLDSAEPAEDEGYGGDHLAALYFTGGTTGRSKGVMLSHENLYINCLGSIPFMPRSQSQCFVQASPIFHVAAGARHYTSTMNAAHVVYTRSFNALEMLQLLQNHRATACSIVPTMLNFMINEPTFGDYDLESLLQISYGASPMPEALLLKAIEFMPQVEFHQGYGMSETSPILTVLTGEDHKFAQGKPSKLTSVGRPVNYCQVRVVDPQGQDLAEGEVGEIVARGPNVMQGYWGLPELTAEVIKDGWYHTGDGGFFDEDGYLYLVDRVKDMIVSGGENVYSAEVESAIYRHPAILQCAVIGIPNDTWGEAVHTIITLKQGQTCTEAELIDFCRQNIAGYKCPRSVDVMDSLPMSGANKVLKRELRDAYWPTQ